MAATSVAAMCILRQARVCELPCMPENGKGMNDTSTSSSSEQRAASSKRGPIVAIDGPAGAGKSTVATHLAKTFGLLNLETGAMYRALALKAMGAGVGLEDAAALEAMTATTRMHLEPGEGGNRVLLDGVDVTTKLRAPEVTAAASRVSVHPPVRAWMVAEQRAMGLHSACGVVMEGRDIGTVVFPDATVKLFLDASVEARGDRRFQQQAGATAPNGESRERITQQIAERDGRDRSREASPLRPAEDAVVLETTGMSLDQVLVRAADLVRAAIR